LGTIPDNSITSAKIVDGAIVNADINASAGITYGKLNLTNSIVTADITAGAVTAAKLGNDIQLTPPDGSITTVKLAAGAVTTAKIADDAVTASKLADTTVTAGSYTTADITVDAQGRITAASTGVAAQPTDSDQNILANRIF